MTRKVKQSEFRVQPETCHCIKPSNAMQHTCAHTHIWATGLSEIYMGRLLYLRKKENEEERSKKCPFLSQFYFSLLCHYWLHFNFIKNSFFFTLRNTARGERWRTKATGMLNFKLLFPNNPFSLVLCYYSQHIYIGIPWLCNRYHCLSKLR